MLPLITLTTDDITHIAQMVPGGLGNIQDIYALTPLQEGILFHHLLAEQGDPYLLTGQMAFPDRERLDSYLAAIQIIVDRHDILRTCFVWEGLSCAAQVVLRNARLSVTELSLNPSQGTITEQLATLFDPRVQRIDLGQPPLLRFVIAHDPEQKRWLLLEQLHHLIGDHSTLDVMNAEVLAILSGRKDTLKAPQPFRNLVAQTRLGVSQEEHETFFRNMLGDIDEPTLPFGLSNVHLDGVQVDEATLTLPQTLNDRLREQARRLGVSLASLCHLAWGRVVSATSGRSDVVFGTVLFGRMNAGEGADQAMGLFINTLPLRLTLDATSAADSVRATHAILAELLRHEHASLALAQQCSGLSAGTPLFSALLNYRHNQVSSQLDHDPVYQELLEGITFLGAEERTNYPLTLSVEDYGTSLGLTAQVITPHDAAEICRYMEMVLSGLADALDRDPARPVNALAVMPPEERTLVLETWNDTATPWPQDLCLHQMVEAQVLRTPDAPAVICEDTCLSYAELNTRANRLAHHLVALGVTPDSPVAICLDRSAEMVVGLLAILKAGGAYLPLDPAYPSSRLAQILDDAKPAIILLDRTGEQALGDALPQAMTRLHPRAPSCSWDACPDTAPELASLAPHNLAYVIYTSGSTGTPKGVAVEHRNIVSHTSWQIKEFAFSSSDRVLQRTSPSFDAAGWEFWSTLSSGAILVIETDPQVVGFADVFEIARKSQITILQGVPSLFANAHLEPLAADRTTLRCVFCGGEEADIMLLQRLGTLSDAAFVNLYGPTEATIDALFWQLPPGVLPENQGKAPIGRPIANTRIYLLDGQGEPVPPGVAGELYIGGAGVARGYLNRPDLTAERFLDDPFARTPGARMYRTGDLARYRPDGNIEFLGRADQQVKIRGFRIEPGEIEARLTECSGVRTAAVIAREDIPGDRRLVGYVVPEPDATPDPATLRRALAAVLPDYMVPAALVLLDTLPLTPNGKLDRKALPAPDDSAFVRAEYVAPTGKVETALAKIWQDLLGLERIGRTDNFFELGGHSLLAVQMMERLRRIGLPTEVRTLFGSPVLADLARAVGDSHSVVVPANSIPENPAAITPDMLPLITLTTDDITHIAQMVPGGLGNIQDIYALTPLQEGILFHHLLAEQGDPYLLTGQMAFPDRERLDSYLAAIQIIVDRHDILRTCFVWEGLSCAAQVVLRNARLSVTELSLNPSQGTITEQLATLFDPRVQRIDLGQPPLLRFVIAHDPEQKRWLLLEQLHHLIGDHSTLDVMNAEVLAILSGRKDTLKAPQPFRNLVAQTRLGVSQEEHETFFRNMLGDIDEPTLPFGLSNVHLDGVQVDEATLTLPQTLNDRLREQARRLGVSLASLCHLAWGRVVSATSGRSDVVFGTVLFGRMNAGEGADQAMGLFINTLPLRLTLDATSAADSVRATHAILAELLRHEHASLALAQQCSGLSAGTPLFSALLNYRHNQVSSQLDHDPVYQELLEGITFLGAEERTNYPLTLSVEDYGTSLGLTAQVITPHDAAEICRYMEMVLSGLADALDRDPARPVNALAVMPPEERTLVLETWNDTATPWPQDLCLHQMVEAQVLRTPDAPAVICEDTCLSYAELNTRANRLAHHLVALGVTPDSPVAICLDRSAEMVVGLLAILKAGGAYLPLDPAYPSSRLAQILDDAKPAIILLDRTGEQALGDALPQAMTRLHPRAPSCPWDACPDTAPELASLAPHNLAYVIYTSGSTGTPKGVAVEHRNAVHLASAEAKVFRLSADIRVIQFASCSFDASIFEILMSLQAGGSLYIPSSIEKEDVSALWNYISVNKITHATLPPAVFHFETDLKLPSSIRFLVLAGEAPDPNLVKSLATGRGMVLVNAYGPTETTVWASAWSCPDDISALVTVPIGRPIANTRIYLLDGQGEPVPPGVAGELYIGGAGVARGYLNRPDLTAERFLDDPFARTPGARMYRTGDLARYRPDGNIEFLGRADQQVKIRGFRIEPGEIEARLTECSGVRTAAVIAREDIPGDRRLVGYVVPEPDATPDPATLRRALAAVLPDYMVPAALVLLDALPLTPNGKLDRKALPAPDFTPAGEGRAPRNPQEAILAALFAEVLGLTRVGIDDSFFDLGGHSLLATRLASRIRSSLNIDLPVRAVFENPTVAGLAEATAGQEDSNRPPLVPMTRPAILPLSFAQQRLWFLFRLEGPSATYNMPLSIQMDGPLSIAAMQTALGDVVARHESLRTVFPEVDGIACQQVLATEDPRCTVLLDHRHVAGHDLDRTLAAIAATPIDIANELPLRAFVLEVTPVRHVLVVLVHHIAADGWSMAPFARDLAQAYDARTAGTQPAFTPLPVQYADYTLWQRTLLGNADDPDSLYAQQADYWQTTLAGLPECITLPTDRPRPAVSAYQGATVPLIIPPELAGRLGALGKASGTSVFMILQAALAVLLGKLGAGDDIAIGSPIAGRTETALENLVGFFVNTLVLRTDLSGNPTITDLLAQVRERSLAAYGHQDLPFEKLVEILNPARAQNHHPLFQVMLVLQNTTGTHLKLTGLQAYELPVDNTVAKFDLTFTLAEDKDGLTGEIEYDTALFDAETIKSMATRYLRVLDIFASQNNRPIGSIDVLEPAERKLLLETWNDTATPWPQDLCLHQMVEAQVLRTPDAPAVICEDTCLSYAELNTRANRLAHYLVALGVTPDSPVAICLDRSAEMVVGLLAILKAGGAYLPLDPAYPSSRLAQILDDAKPAIILLDRAGEQALGDALPQDMTRLHPRAPSCPWDTCPDTAPELASLAPHNLAYVIYTSGSTGTPKGVAVEHRNAVHLASAEAKVFRLSADIRVIQFASCSFDASIFEILMSLQAGGSLYIPSSIEKEDVSALWNYISVNKITHATLPPAVFHFETDLKLPSSIRFLVLAGEAPDPNLVKSLATGRGMVLVNAYGPTETTVWASAWSCPDDISALVTVPIGRPIANTRIYLLDGQGEPVPPGVAGELYIGGAGVARGYLNRPDLTAERFLDDPFARTPGARMYRTGDLARYRPDGNIEFLGRADQQVKIRGFRIEPGEIEARLTECSGVRTAAVIAREDIPGDRRLVGYVVPEPDATPDPATLRRALAAVLPDYMVPAALVLLDTLPLTPNGKLDRKALPAPDFTPAGEGRAPRNPQEAILAALFAEVLGLTRVGIDDSFFDLGGHSLLATRLASRIRATLDMSLPVRTLFETPTVAGLAEILGDGKSTPDGSLIGLRERGTRAPLFCIHGGFGLVWPYRNLLDKLDAEIPLYAFQARGLEGDETLPDDMIALIDDYIDQMRRTQPSGPYHILGWSFGAVAAQAMATRLQEQGDQVALLILLDGYPSSDPHALETVDDRDYEAALQALMDEYGMQGIDPDMKAAIIAVFRNCTRIQLQYRPAVYSGDMIFLRAADEPDPVTSGDPAQWNTYLRGKMTVLDINASHSQMLEPNAANKIAFVINKTLV
ncbi:amino acid adenylation domain-containing protein [Komagataeibacter nataicola]|uniref:non-ribosomal peptide synthetase n=1 Tax=Komagataeibacter nataicola TaxID=265960 RepID=UPI0023DD5F9C|nr:non-ribosomal peptide synthetase [Komagataeibacter nataicola]WEQ54976.1 amino acid adenylation domain-containing protein [Komagataeibacter nataicola]